MSHKIDYQIRPFSFYTANEFALTLPHKKIVVYNSEGGIHTNTHADVKTLQPMFSYAGLVDGEHCWSMPLGMGRLRLFIHSAIDAHSGVADRVRHKSIRIFIQRNVGARWYSIHKGPCAYTDLTLKWKTALKEKIKSQYSIWSKVKQDFTEEEKLYVSKQSGTKGRVFAKHSGTGRFRWLS